MNHKLSNNFNNLQLPIRIDKHGEGNGDYYGQYFFVCGVKSDWVSDYDRLLLNRFSSQKNGLQAMLVFNDGRKISGKQRKMAYILLNLICKHHGYDKFAAQELRETLKIDYIKKSNSKWFSLSDCNMTEANNYIKYLIYFSVETGIELPVTLVKDEHTSAFIYACLMNRKCVISGEPNADIHHCSGKVGAGRNRRKVDNRNSEFLPLSRKYHQEAHTIGDNAFFEKYKLYGMKLNEQDLDQLGLLNGWYDVLEKENE